MFIPNKMFKKTVIKAFEKAYTKADIVLRDTARNNAPVDSGTLKAEIDVERGGVVSNAPYSAAVEFGTYKKEANPFMRKSIVESKPRYFKQFKGII
jgi:HK97 gp10 family phage protein